MRQFAVWGTPLQAPSNRPSGVGRCSKAPDLDVTKERDMSERAVVPPLPAQPLPPIGLTPRGPVPAPPATSPRRRLHLTVNGQEVLVPEDATLLQAAREAGVEIPTLCFLETLTPVNVCRICVVELEGSRTLVPACSRRVEEGMVVKTDSERVRLSRRLVLEFLASSVDVSASPQ